MRRYVGFTQFKNGVLRLYYVQEFTGDEIGKRKSDFAILIAQLNLDNSFEYFRETHITDNSGWAPNRYSVKAIDKLDDKTKRILCKREAFRWILND